ncbi:hypothetical protein, partial [Actinomadura sp. RB99]|uniref:hypothetical protein n=1 Tax=Actinomadura sp. RB99 TaxID=2691577 RepID=UPI00168351D2
MVSTLQTFVRGADLRIIGEIRGWRTLEVTLRYMQVGSWQITGAADSLVARLAEPGRGLVVRDPRGVPLHAPDGVLISGDLGEDGPQEYAAGDSGKTGAGSLQLTGGDDL